MLVSFLSPSVESRKQITSTPGACSDGLTIKERLGAKRYVRPASQVKVKVLRKSVIEPPEANSQSLLMTICGYTLLNPSAPVIIPMRL